MSKTILVAGGAGFLGSHLCMALITQGHHVLCVDNFYTGSKDNLTALLDHPRFHLLVHDICSPLELGAVDEIYNLACPASPIHYQNDPVQTTRTSVLGALHLLELSRRLGAKILQASTSEVYGDPHIHPQPESYWGHVNPIGLRACYDEGKRCAETLFFDYHRQYGIPIKIARIFNTYGPHMHPQDGRVISNFIVQALLEQPLTIYGRGTQTRSLCYVSDLIAGLIALMNSSEIGPMNLGNPEEHTILQIAEKILALTGSRARCLHHPLPSDDPKQRRPDISYARACLHWNPLLSLEEGLIPTIAYFSSCLKSLSI